MMMKRFIILLLILFMPVFPAWSQQPELSVAAKSFILTDYHSGQTLASANPHERLDPASLTKLMTAYVVFEALNQHRIQPDQVVPVSKKPGA